MLALSTAWNADRWSSGAAIAQEIYNLGIRQIELNFSLTPALVKEIFQFCREHSVAISSLHNYCPIPDGFSRQEALPDCFSLSALDENERKEAVKYTQKTIATAQRVGGRVVVLHTGRVEMEDRTRELIALHGNGESKSEGYKQIFETFIRERQQQKKPFIDQILKSLEELQPFAQEHSIALGVENRFYYREIPTIDEYETIFNRFNGTIGYWHDVGHAFIHEKLGFMEEGALLKKFGSRLIGFHLHNVKNLADHQAPTEGDFDFTKLAPYVKIDTLKIIEAHKMASTEDIKKSISYLEKIFPET